MSLPAQIDSILLKLSGEALGGEAGFGLDPSVLNRICAEITQLQSAGTKLAIVLGGGNLFRGQHLAADGMDRVVGDRMGMLATIMNGLALSDYLERAGVPNALFSAVGISGSVAAYHRDVARDAMQTGKVVILSGGTGNPFFTTDTAACLRGIELGCDVVVKATNVDGVYSADPKIDPQAKKLQSVSYDEVLAQGLQVMDLTAIVLCKEHAMPLVVFDLNQPGALLEVAGGAAVGSTITP